MGELKGATIRTRVCKQRRRRSTKETQSAVSLLPQLLINKLIVRWLRCHTMAALSGLLLPLALIIS